MSKLVHQIQTYHEQDIETFSVSQLYLFLLHFLVRYWTFCERTELCSLTQLWLTGIPTSVRICSFHFFSQSWDGSVVSSLPPYVVECPPEVEDASSSIEPVMNCDFCKSMDTSAESYCKVCRMKLCDKHLQVNFVLFVKIHRDAWSCVQTIRPAIDGQQNTNFIYIIRMWIVKAGVISSYEIVVV